MLICGAIFMRYIRREMSAEIARNYAGFSSRSTTSKQQSTLP